jgi:1-acyl-sn-glycerol-3-phosphate acyltransferase
MPYIPQLGIEYPDRPDEHMLHPEAVIDVVLDETYPFLDKSLLFRLWSALEYLGIFTLVFPLNILRYGLRIEGRSILKKNKALLKNGAMSISNHVLRWDYLMVLQALRWRTMHVAVWRDNVAGPDRNLIRLAGGIPIPDKLGAIKYFNAAFDELVAKKQWFHMFPESTNWHYFAPIRPFKKGVFTMAYRYGIPIIPIAFSYRPAAGLYRLWKKKYPLITLRIGEPVVPDATQPRRDEVQRLRSETHRRIVELAGIENNPYPAEAD